IADQLFRPFATSKSNGMGLGLSICKTIIEAHGGEISAKTGVNGGARFVFQLPRDRAKEQV
ncbi:MAG: ATP-binding protein, partial [Pseudomonadota bacterium]